MALGNRSNTQQPSNRALAHFNEAALNWLASSLLWLEVSNFENVTRVSKRITVQTLNNHAQPDPDNGHVPIIEEQILSKSENQPVDEYDVPRKLYKGIR
jgi:hypothetical protein